MSMLEFPDEVVTHSRSACSTCPSMPAAWPSSPWTTASTTPSRRRSGSAELSNSTPPSTRSRPRRDLAGVAVTGKPFIFAVGADLKVMQAGWSATGRSATEYLALGHPVFRQLDGIGVPTFAFVNGAALGGGLELALHCSYRTISSGVPALAFPEVFLGLIPGWGGSQLLPNLIGAEAAVTVIVENALNQNRELEGLRRGTSGHRRRDVRAGRLPRAVDGLGRRRPARRHHRRAPRDRPQRRAWQGALARGKGIADMKVHGATPAPYKALELIDLSRSASFDEGTKAEARALAELAFGEELRASLYAFDLVQRRAKRPAGVPGQVAGATGHEGGHRRRRPDGQPARHALRPSTEVPVVLTDLDARSGSKKGLGQVHPRGSLATMVAKRRLTQRQGQPALRPQ